MKRWSGRSQTLPVTVGHTLLLKAAFERGAAKLFPRCKPEGAVPSCRRASVERGRVTRARSPPSPELP